MKNSALYLIINSYTEEEINERFPFLTYEERLPLIEFDILTAAKRIASRWNKDASKAITDAQHAMSQAFKVTLEEFKDQERTMLRNSEDVARVMDHEENESHSVIMSPDSVTIAMSTWCGDGAEFSRTLYFPFTDEDFHVAWNYVRNDVLDWEFEHDEEDEEEELEEEV